MLAVVQERIRDSVDGSMECPVCFEVFRTPLLLPGCGHTICRACAEMLISSDNLLRCPECRLMYQLRQGIKSLPKNVALQRTIDEQNKSSSSQTVMCDQHPDDSASLYCKTCEKSICLKCYFSSTLRRGQSLHTGHDVDTSDDVRNKEKRILEETLRQCQEITKEERLYVNQLEEAEAKLKSLLDHKLELIEKNKNELISQVKQTGAKVKFTLKGSCVRDSENLQITLTSARERLSGLTTCLEYADDILLKAVLDQTDVTAVKDAIKQLEVQINSADCEKPPVESFLKIDGFDPDIIGCLDDSKKALSYQSEAPRNPEILLDRCVISNTTAHIVVKYNQVNRAKNLTLHYKEAQYKGMSEKQFQPTEITEFNKGTGTVCLTELNKGTMYRMYATASNDFGNSPPSQEVWFRTLQGETEIRAT